MSINCKEKSRAKKYLIRLFLILTKKTPSPKGKAIIWYNYLSPSPLPLPLMYKGEGKFGAVLRSQGFVPRRG